MAKTLKLDSQNESDCGRCDRYSIVEKERNGVKKAIWCAGQDKFPEGEIKNLAAMELFAIDSGGLSGSVLPDGLLYHGRHDITELFARAGHTPAIPLIIPNSLPELNSKLMTPDLTKLIGFSSSRKVERTRNVHFMQL